MYKAFLSHSSLDKPVVRKIKEKIQRIWTYFDEDCFEPGEDFRSAIVERLSNTNLFVLFVSKSSLDSAWVKFEIDEAYWQTIKRNNISVLVLTLEDVSLSAIPAWMQKAKFEAVHSPKQAAQIIRNMLFDSVSMSGGVYIGREADILKFNNDLIQYKDKVPNVFAITGLNGIGRRTFIKDIFEKRFALPFIAQFELSGTEGLIELYRKLLDENIENLSSERINELYSWFLSASPQDQSSEVCRVLALHSSNRTCPIIVDNNALLKDDGYYRPDILHMLKTFSHDYPDCYLVLVHTRLPKLDYNDEGLAHLCRLNALDESSCYALFDALLKRQAVETPDQSQVKEIASYLEGYPPSIYNAVKACSLEGVDLVCSDKRALLDFQERIFKDFLDKLPFSDAEWNVLTALYNMGNISIAPLAEVLDSTLEDVAQLLKKVYEYNVVVCTEGLYSIAPPMRVAIERKLRHYTPNDFAKISRKLIARFWNQHQESSISFSLIDTMIYAVLRSGQDDELMKFKNYVLPSHLLEAAEKANRDMQWEQAERYARKAIELDQDLLPAHILLFKVLVRQENGHTRAEKNREEDKILEILQAAHSKETDYLEGFRNLKRHRYYDAIKALQRAILSGDSSIPTYRDLAECYYQVNEVEKAQEQIDNIMSSGNRKINNAFILDLASKIAISQEKFDKVTELLDKQSLVDHPENVEHRKATYEIKKGNYPKAFEHATNACNGERALPQMHLLRMNIAIHLEDWKTAEEEYKKIDELYKHYPFDVREILHTTLILRTQGGDAAEAAFKRIHHPNTPYARGIRYKIIEEQLRSGFINPIKKQALISEKSELETQKMFDILNQLQCYDGD